MMSLYFYELVLSFFIFHYNFRNDNVDNLSGEMIFFTNEFLTSNRFIYRKFHSITISNITHKDVLFSSYRLIKCFLFATKNSHPYQSFKVESDFL